MANYTENLNLLKKDPVADASDTFNIQTMMNDNWDKLDATALKAQAAKTAPIDADAVPVIDSADSSKTKLTTWANIKVVLKTAFDSIYAAATHTHAWSTITGIPGSFTPSTHKNTHSIGGTDALESTDLGLDPTTAAKFFASPVGTESVDQVLSLLGRFQRGMGNEYVWEKGQWSYSYAPSDYTNYISGLVYGNSSPTLYYGDSFHTDGANYVIDNPSTTTPANIALIKGKYMSWPLTATSGVASQLLFIPSNASFSNSGGTLVISAVTIYSPISMSYTKVSYVNSPDSNAYPPAESDGYTYTALGQIGNKAQIATGSYTGTGTYGSSNPTVINTGNQNTKILFVFRSDGAFAGIFLSGLSSGIVIATDGSTSVQRAVSSDANGIFSIYHATTAAYQFNQSGFTYKFISIG